MTREDKLNEAAKAFARNRYREEYLDPVFEPDIQNSIASFKAGCRLSKYAQTKN